MSYKTKKQIKEEAKKERRRRVIRWRVDGGYRYTWIEEKRSFLGFEYWSKIVRNRPYKRQGDPNEKIYNLLCEDRANYKSNLECGYYIYSKGRVISRLPGEEDVDGIESKETFPRVLKNRR